MGVMTLHGVSSLLTNSSKGSMKEWRTFPGKESHVGMTRFCKHKVEVKRRDGHKVFKIVVLGNKNIFESKM
ncbi:Hypothetical predicted protein [Octopus vulgaris]|uniref:Uncharacterized protein n=1 Tax=Octopus vulgaris TaxID=6645 RepID=A0AA36F944_OCTVU|nr:Hypothetical predicted protein [Octopus vulgaris]